MAAELEKVVEDEVICTNISEGVLDLEENADLVLKAPLEKPDVLIEKEDSSAFLLDFVPHVEIDEGKRGQRVGSSNISVSGVSSDSRSEMKVFTTLNSNFLTVLKQVVLPFILAGLGTVAAGILLNIFVSESRAFYDVPEIIILVPTILGLKGNIEMTLASRLSTAANLGNLDYCRSAVKLVVANLTLVQFQAGVLGLVASFAAIVIGQIWNTGHALVICAASVFTTGTASFVLGTLMATVIIVAKQCKIDPDNIATPIAASVGDVVTLTILEWSARHIHELMAVNGKWVPILVIFLSVMGNVLWWNIASYNKSTRRVLRATSSWISIFSGMALACISGKILDYSVKRYSNIAVFQPTMNGVGGNLVAIQASKIATYLHCHNTFGFVDIKSSRVCSSITRAFYDGAHAKTAWILLILLVPGHALFTTIAVIHDKIDLTWTFMFFFIVAAIIQVVFLLYLVDILVHFLWNCRIDPDNTVIPILTSTADLLGTGLLAVAFELTYIVRGHGGDRGV